MKYTIHTLNPLWSGVKRRQIGLESRSAVIGKTEMVDSQDNFSRERALKMTGNRLGTRCVGQANGE